ncbi:NAD(P)/FAD-dependent oxidoreductase [Synechococcus sp. BDU 130192]|uniref:NAD(P)/FAD-dependent oxidoreductase n=1 Tax=Synechococcus sp. BDU 130192 TaxID=2042059 RepID=UPI000C0883E0|nr:FAD-dependent oxidoreductase [Synechococcus sp. BDU 130192]
MGQVETILGAMPGDPLKGLRAADQRWQNWRQGQIGAPAMVQIGTEDCPDYDCDVLVCGGTLGLLLAAALQRRGWRVIILERGPLQGRVQEWNISRSELQTFLDLDLLSETELREVIVTEFNPLRIQFHGGDPLWVKDILNIGVSPRRLLAILKEKFLTWGGKIFENHPCTGITVSPQGAIARTEKFTFHTRLILDGMGHFSPIAQQVRQGQKPDGVCLVVGSCAQGFAANSKGDLIYSFTPIRNQCQYFWEAFPAHDGRTTYLFTYLDAHPQRFDLAFLLEEYLKLLPDYQQVDLAALDFQRFLFGFFPSYRRSPLRYPWDRILPIGDSSGGQSPVSFGGFGAMLRHLERLTNALDDALTQDCCDRQALAQLQPYQPNLSVTWLFQKAMSVGVNQSCPPNQINDLLNAVFGVMAQLGEDTLNPFLQDVVQFQGLTKTLPRVNFKTVLPLLPHLGVGALADWLRHYLALGLYTSGYALSQRLPMGDSYQAKRRREAWQYGSGQDFHQAGLTEQD